VIDGYPGAWLVWCDRRRDWLPLLKQAASGAGGFTLHAVTAELAGHIGGVSARAELQKHLSAGESFVLCVPSPADRLGWLWAQALLAERIYDRPLRDQLRDWGWQPHTLTMTEDEVAALARRSLDQDPGEWGGAALQPDKALLLEVLAGGSQPEADQRLLLDLTTQQAGLPPVDEANLPLWRTRCLARLLVTEADAAAPGLVPEGHELLIRHPERTLALQILDDWCDSIRLSRGLPEAILQADAVAGLGNLPSASTRLDGPYLSQALEQAVFSRQCARLAALVGQPLIEELAGLEGVAERHAHGFWGLGCQHPKAIPWLELQRLCRAARALLESGSSQPWTTPAQAVAWYTSDGWGADRAGEGILRDLIKPAPALLSLIGPLRAAYRARWEQAMIEWSRVWTEAGCPTPDLPTAGTWLAERLQQPRPTAILVLDALRYDLGCQLAERINQQEGTSRAAVAPARAPLPTVTPLGMALALPLPEAAVEADVVDGKWQVRQAGHGDDLGLAAARRAWWQRHGHVPADAMLDMAAVQAGQIPAPGPGRARLVVHDAAIDALGHEDVLEAQGAGSVLDRYLLAVERLRSAGWLRILAVTDHGFLHWPVTEEKNVAPPIAAPPPAYSSRRALAYPSHVSFPGPQGLAPGGRWRGAVPYGAASFRAYGGLGYFHGGASLQEWIIPCLAVEWPLQAKPVGVTFAPLHQVLGQRVRVHLQVQRASLFVEEGLPRQVVVVIRDAATHNILFEAKPVTATPDLSQLDATAIAREGATASRGTHLRLEVRDYTTEEVLDTCDSTLGIELTGW